MRTTATLVLIILSACTLVYWAKPDWLSQGGKPDPIFGPTPAANQTQMPTSVQVDCYFSGLDCQTLFQPIQVDRQVLGYGVLLPQDAALVSPVWGEATTGQLNMLLPDGFKGFQVLTVYPDKDIKPARIEFILAQAKEFTPKTLIKGARIIDISAEPAEIGRFGRFDLVIRAFDAQDKPIDPRSYLDKP